MAYRDITQNTNFRSGTGDFNAQEFSERMREMYRSKMRKDEKKTKKSFAPSGVGYGSGTCPRYWHLAFSGTMFIENTDELAIANMENGKYVHERLQTMFEESGLEVEMEKEILSEDPPIRGFADVILKWKDNDVVGEIKSMRDEIYALRKVNMQPLPYHTVQLLIYMKVLGLKDGFFIYENKNTQEFIVIPVSMTERNEKIVDDMFDWMRKIWANFNAEEPKLPERPFKKSSKECKYCPVREACWKELGAGEEYFPPLVVKV
jgi:CRISPR-associated protein Cas4